MIKSFYLDDREQIVAKLVYYAIKLKEKNVIEDERELLRFLLKKNMDKIKEKTDSKKKVISLSFSNEEELEKFKKYFSKVMEVVDGESVLKKQKVRFSKLSKGF